MGGHPIPWGEERDLISDDLNAQKEALGKQIEELINAPGFDQKLWARAKVRQELNITEFAFIMTNLPEDLRPAAPITERKARRS